MKRLLQPKFFARSPDVVAAELLGKKIFTDLGEPLETIIWRVGAYEDADRTTDQGIIQAPGIVNISCKFAQYLIDICTEQEGVYSCVTLYGYMDDGQKVKGSGKTSKRLGIDKFNKSLVQGDLIGPSRNIGIYVKPELTGFAIDVEHPHDKGGNCLGIYYIK